MRPGLMTRTSHTVHNRNPDDLITVAQYFIKIDLSQHCMETIVVRVGSPLATDSRSKVAKVTIGKRIKLIKFGRGTGFETNSAIPALVP